MRKHISILFVVGLLTCFMPMPGLAQGELTEYVADELKNFYKELDKMGRRIDTAANVEMYETEFKARHQLVESWYNLNSEIVFSDKGLQTKYIQYTSRYEEIQKRIDEKKAEKAKAEKIQKLTAKFNGFLQDLNVMEEKGKQHVANKRADSLKMVKEKANDCLTRATMEYGKNQELIDDEDDLSTLWMRIKETNSHISNMEVIKTSFDIKTLLMIVGILAGITMIISMISSKVKAAKMTKVPKVKKKKKVKEKEEDIPSI